MLLRFETQGGASSNLGADIYWENNVIRGLSSSPHWHPKVGNSDNWVVATLVG